MSLKNGLHCVEAAKCLVIGYIRQQNEVQQNELNISFAEQLILKYFSTCGLIFHAFNLPQIIDDINKRKSLKELFTLFIAVNHNNSIVQSQTDQKLFEISYGTQIFFAYFIHTILNKSSPIVTDLENIINNILDFIVSVYEKFDDKDIFERDYQQYLANRLLNGLSEHSKEELFINKLECAHVSRYYFGAKLKTMIKDTETSTQTMQIYHKTYPLMPFHLNVTVCSSYAWPSSSIYRVAMPNELTMAVQQFKNFWTRQHGGRPPYLQPNQGTAEVRVQFNANKNIWKILVVSTYQMLVLLLFNKQNTYSFQEIITETCIAKHELMGALLSMLHPKVKVMRKSPNNKNIENHHKFQINPNFTNPRVKIKIPTIKYSNNWNESKNKQKNMEAILRQRMNKIDIAIVQAMKKSYAASKTLSHSNLIRKTTEILKTKFVAQPRDINKRITSLCESGYLKRDEFDTTIYHYVP